MNPKSDRRMSLHEMESLSPEGLSSDQERRRLPRVSLSSEQFRLISNGKIFAVTDLSSGGMALRLLTLEDRVLFPVGAVVEGWLNLNRCKYRVGATVRNIRGDHVGFEFVNLSSEIREQLSRWLDPAELGQSLRMIPMPLGFDGGLSQWLWFHGRAGTEILAFLPEGQLQKLIVVLWGERYVEWSETAIFTGRIRFADERGGDTGVLRVAPEWFEADLSLDPEKLNLAKLLVSHSKVPQSWKNWVTASREVKLNGS